MCALSGQYFSQTSAELFLMSVVCSSICSNIGFSHRLHYIAVTPQALKTELVLISVKVIIYMCKNIYAIRMLISEASLFF